MTFSVYLTLLSLAFMCSSQHLSETQLASPLWSVPTTEGGTDLCLIASGNFSLVLTQSLQEEGSNMTWIVPSNATAQVRKLLLVLLMAVDHLSGCVWRNI